MFDFFKKRACPGCHEKYISYRLKKYNKAYTSSLIHVKKLKYGELFQCINCNLYWLLDEKPDDIKTLHRINPSNLSFIEKWGTQVLKPNISLLNTLIKIGATGGEKNRKIPCRCTTKDGREIDFCLVTFVEHPADILNYEHKEVLLIDEVATIHESSYSLSHLIRYASFYAREIRMCFAPIQIVSNDGKYFIINGPVNLFDLDGYKGNEMSLPLTLQNEQEIDKYYSEQHEKITYIIADWDEDKKNQISIKPSNYRDLYKVPWIFIDQPFPNELARRKINDFTNLIIHKYIEFNDWYICVFYVLGRNDIPTDLKKRNIIAFDQNGNFIWQIAHNSELENLSGKEDNFYTNVYLDDDDNLWCGNFIGESHRVNSKTGEILEHKYTK